MCKCQIVRFGSVFFESIQHNQFWNMMALIFMPFSVVVDLNFVFTISNLQLFVLSTAAITWACLDCCCKPIELPNASEYNTDLVLRRWMLHPETTPSRANKHEVVRFENIKMARWCVWFYAIWIVCMLYVYG